MSEIHRCPEILACLHCRGHLEPYYSEIDFGEEYTCELACQDCGANGPTGSGETMEAALDEAARLYGRPAAPDDGKQAGPVAKAEQEVRAAMFKGLSELVQLTVPERTQSGRKLTLRDELVDREQVVQIVVRMRDALNKWSVEWRKAANADVVAPDDGKGQAVGELRDWIDTCEAVANAGEAFQLTTLRELAAFLKTLGNHQLMVENLTLIASLSGLDNLLIKGADKFIFARMAEIHQAATSTLAALPKSHPAPQGWQQGAAAEIRRLFFDDAEVNEEPPSALWGYTAKSLQEKVEAILKRRQEGNK